MFLNESKINRIVEGVIKDFFKGKGGNRRKEESENEKATKEYWRQHTQFYLPRGWDKYTDRKGNFDFEKWWYDRP